MPLPEFQPNIFHQEQEEGEANQEEQKPQQAPRKFSASDFVHFAGSKLGTSLIDSALGLLGLGAKKWAD